MTDSKNQEPISLEHWSRRGFLGAGTLAAAAFAAPAKALAQDMPQPKTLIPQSINSKTTYTAFSEPPPLSSNAGELDLSLTVEQTNFTYNCNGNSFTVSARHFSGYMPGPTMVVKPGDKIKFNLTNHLAANDPSCPGTLNTPHCFNTTNMHFHGLHVSPASYYDPPNEEKVLSSDDVLYELTPGMSHDWCVWLPDFHAPGTHWYHAHLHGATGLQVSNGMVGAIIVQEPDQEHNIVAPLDDKLLIVQEIIDTEIGAGSSETDPDMVVYRKGGKGGAFSATIKPKTGGDFLINGLCKPTLSLLAGKVQRWRFVNATATPRGLLSLELREATGPDDTSTTGNLVDMYLMAVDGISFYGKPPEPIGLSNTRNWTGWQMSPGNRADFLVKLSAGNNNTETKWYKLVKNTNPGGGTSTVAQVLAYIEVQPAGFDEEIPDIIPGSLADFPYLTPITQNDLANVDEEGNVCPRGLTFRKAKFGDQGYQVNNQLYCPTCANIEVDLGTAEQWQLNHQSGSAHPFHIHVNPFQIVGDRIDPNGPDQPDNWRWWDTIALFSGTGSSGMQPLGSTPLTIQQWFVDYPGTYVLHCHVLIHEDQGMMMNVTVNDANNEGAPPCASLDTPIAEGGVPHVGSEVQPTWTVYPSLTGCDTTGCGGTKAAAVEPNCPTATPSTQSTPTLTAPSKGNGNGTGKGGGKFKLPF